MRLGNWLYLGTVPEEEKHVHNHRLKTIKPVGVSLFNVRGATALLFVCECSNGPGAYLSKVIDGTWNWADLLDRGPAEPPDATMVMPRPSLKDRLTDASPTETFERPVQ